MIKNPAQFFIYFKPSTNQIRLFVRQQSLNNNNSRFYLLAIKLIDSINQIIVNNVVFISIVTSTPPHFILLKNQRHHIVLVSKIVESLKRIIISGLRQCLVSRPPLSLEQIATPSPCTYDVRPSSLSSKGPLCRISTHHINSMSFITMFKLIMLSW